MTTEKKIIQSVMLLALGAETEADRPAFSTTQRLAVEEGLFVGMSSGAGDRYLSTNLFRSVCAECPP